jgi:dCTP deaminase
MSALPDHWIEEMARTRRMIDPLAPNRRRRGRISSGLSSYGYDFRLSDEFKVPELGKAALLDPKKMDRVKFRDFNAAACPIAPNSFVLARSLEYFRMPRDVMALCFGKSTYARCGLIVNVTPLEPEWEGYLTVSLVNVSPVPLRVYAGEGIAQLVFLRAESECDVSYSDRKGKYQSQKKIQVARV